VDHPTSSADTSGTGPAAADVIAQLRAALGAVDDATLVGLAPDAEQRVLPAGAILFREGDPSDAMYVVVRGELRATIGSSERGETIVGRIGPGEPVGEMQILSGGLRTATVTAATETALTRVPRLALERLARETPHAMRHLADAIRRRVRRNQLVDILPSFFGPLDEATLREIEEVVQWIALPRGETLFEQGDDGQTAYILVNGRLQVVVRDAAGAEKTVGEVQHGEAVGEMAIFTNEPRSATVRALRDSALVALDRAACEQLVVKYPQTLMALTRLVIHRLRTAQSGAPAETVLRTVAVVAASPDVPLGAFARQLAMALGEIGTTLHVAAAEVDRRLGTPGLARAAADDPRAARIAAWIDEQEMRHRFLVLEADPTASPWSVRCVRQADRILVVADATGDPTPSDGERALVDHGPTAIPASLVLLHPPDTRVPSGTRRWLVPRRLVRHHHVRLDVAADVARVARFTVGRAFGVALGGGGARGFAHIGVLDAMQEAGIPIDIIGGTSMGACIAAEYALGWDRATMMRRNDEMFGRWRRDLTLPLLAILAGHRSSARLREQVGDVQIEDLWLPYFCVSSNLSRAEMMVHRDGPLWRGLRASVSLPGILPPLALDGDLLVDGALLRNLPADVVRRLSGGGTTIAVDVSADRDMQHEHPYEHAISGWRIVWSRMNPLVRKNFTVPSIASVLQRSGEIASVAMQREALLHGVDLYLRVPVQRFGLLEFRAAPDIVAAGYEYARVKLGEWLATMRQQAPDRGAGADVAATAMEPT